MFTPSCSKDIWIRKLDFVSKAPFLCVQRTRASKRDFRRTTKTGVFHKDLDSMSF